MDTIYITTTTPDMVEKGDIVSTTTSEFEQLKEIGMI